MKLTGEQFEQLEQALLGAYPTEDDLKRMVRIVFNRPLQAVAEGADQTARIDHLIEWAESEGNELVDLIRGAHRRKPGSDLLRAFCEAHSQDLLKDACKENFSQLKADTIFGLLALPLGLISRSLFLEAGLLALPPGATDDSSNKDLTDFQNQDLSLTIRFYGFLRLALGQFPKAKDGQPTVLIFARELHDQLSNDAAAKPFLADWVQRAELEVAPPTRPAPARLRTRNKRGTLETSLMITVRRYNDPAKQQQEGQPFQYQVEGWLYFDQISGLDVPRSLPKPPFNLALSETPDRLGIVCTWKQLPKRVDDFLKEANSQLRHQVKQELGYRSYTLTLEMFLPVDYMGAAIDQWPRTNRATPLGLDYGIIVRFCDRIDNDERQYQISLAWDQLQDVLQSPEGGAALHHHIEAPENLDQYSSWQELERRLKSKLGLKLCCGLPKPQADQKGLFEAMLYGDIPVAVWSRSPNVVDSDSNPAKPLDLPQALTPYFDMDCLQHPTKLAAKLKAVRQQTWPDQTDERYGRCLGDHVACLLDNPDRLPLPDPLGL
jgi:hypothetical protein